jgi:ABC-type transporter Mla MlaB component
MRVEAGVAMIEGDLVLDSATRVLAEAEAALRAGSCVFDLSGVGKMDSSALSLLLALKRYNFAQSPTDAQILQFRNVPSSLSSLAALYGIADQL